MTRAAERKAQIVVEAAELFAAKGFAGVGVQEIGARVGIAAGAIYRHFESKDALLDAVLLDTIEAWLVAAQLDAAPGSGDSQAQIREMVARAVQLVVDRPGPLATYLRERHLVSKATRRVLHRRERELFDRWSTAICAARPGLDTAEMALRQQAINGVLGSLALRPAALAHPRFRSLVNDGLVALLVAPGVPACANAPAFARVWTPPLSRRQEILVAAISRFRQRGYHGVGMDEIGDATGIAGPSLYEYFDSKADILLDAYDQAGALVVAGAQAALAGAASASDALERLARSYIELCFEHVDLIAVTSREGSALPEADRPRLRRRRRDLHETWTGVLRELRPQLSPGDARSLVRAAIALVSQIALHRRDATASVAEAAALVRAFLVGDAGRGSDRDSTEES